MSDAPVLMLISGLYQPARTHAESLGLPPAAWRHIREPEHLFGCRGGTLYVVHGSKRSVEREARLRDMAIEVVR